MSGRLLYGDNFLFFFFFFFLSFIHRTRVLTEGHCRAMQTMLFATNSGKSKDSLSNLSLEGVKFHQQSSVQNP